MAPKYTILIADDHQSLRQLVCVTIASDTYLVLEAADGDEAWQILQTCRPDVALLDVRMPGRDGFALTRAIRADPLLSSVRVILLTGDKDPADIAVGACRRSRLLSDQTLLAAGSGRHDRGVLGDSGVGPEGAGDYPAAGVGRPETHQAKRPSYVPPDRCQAA